MGSDLHHCRGQIGGHTGQAVRAVQDRVTAEDMGPAVLAAENGPLGETGKAVQAHRPSGAHSGKARIL